MNKCTTCHTPKAETFLKVLHGKKICVLCLPFYKGMNKKEFLNEINKI